MKLWKYTYIDSTNEVFSSKKFFEKLQNGAAQADFLLFIKTGWTGQVLAVKIWCII